MDGTRLARTLLVLHNQHFLSSYEECKNKQEVVPALGKGGEYRLVTMKFQYIGVSCVSSTQRAIGH